MESESTTSLKKNHFPLHQIAPTLDLMSDAVVWLTDSNKIQWCNQAFAHLVEKDKPEILGEDFWRILPLYCLGKLVNSELDLLSTELQKTEYEILQGQKWQRVKLSSNFLAQAEFASSIILTIQKLPSRTRSNINCPLNQFQQHEALSHLAQSKAVVTGDLTAALQVITETAAKSLAVNRVSVWLYNRNQTKLECVDLYEKESNRHLVGLERSNTAYPEYFNQLKSNARTIVVNDVRQDERVKELKDSYFLPAKILANLDALIWLAGEIIGVLSYEHSEKPRVWSIDEENFAAVIANFVALALETYNRTQAQNRLARNHALLTAQQEAALDGILAIDEHQRIISYNQKFVELWQINSQLLKPHKHRQLFAYILSQLQEPEEFLSTLEYLKQHPQAISRDEITFKDGRVFDRYSSPISANNGENYGRVWYFRDITQTQQRQAALSLIVEGVTTAIGKSFFQACVRCLVAVTRVKYAFIAQIKQDKSNVVETIAVWQDSELAENFTYDMTNYPCAGIYQGREVCCLDGVTTLFPQAEILTNLGIKSYFGLPLTDSEGKIQGHIAILDDKPIENSDSNLEFQVSILKIFASRAAAEMQRDQVSQALEKEIKTADLLRQISQKIRQSLDTQQIFQTTVEKVGEVFGVSRCHIHAYISSPQIHLPVVAEYRVEPFASLQGKSIAVENNPHARRILSQDAPVVTDDIETEPLLEPSLDFCRQMEIKSLLAVRTSYEGKPNGVLVLHQCDRIRHWEQAEIELLEAVAGQVGTALVQANLLEKEKQQHLLLERQNQQLQQEIIIRKRVETDLVERVNLAELSAEIGLALTQENKLITTLARCATAFRQYLEGIEVRIWTINQQATELVLTAQAGEEGNDCCIYENVQLTDETNPINQIALHKQPYFSNNLREDRQLQNLAECFKTEPYLVFAGYPLVVEQRLVGVMAIVTRCKLTAPKKQTMASSANAIALGITRFWTETILVDSEAKFRTLINNIPGAFYRCAYDSSWTMEFLSEAIFDICGYKAECFIHNQSISFVDLMPLEDRDRVRKAVDLALAQKKPYILEYRLIHADGSIRWAYEKGQGIFDSQGKLLWLDGVIFDITEKKQAEAELKQAKEAAEAANRAKSTFLANMSHELRTPLNAILGFAQLMERDITTNPQQKESLEIINRSGEHLLNLINDVLEMSKIEAGRTIINSQPFDLHYFLHNLQQMFLVKASAKRLSLQFNLSEDLPTCIKTDENKLKQILINLLSNAVKFTEKGSVKLTAKLLPSETIVNSEDLITLSFQIEDTGKGIAAKEIESLFEPFVQTSSGIKSQGGTGLGLAISRQFVELLGGTISVQSIVGKGSIFSFTIKAAATLASEIELRPPSKKVLKLAPHQPTYRILVVDDTLDSRNLLAKLLNTVGFATRTASNGQEAITIWQTWQPDLIWMDMRMPVMDGYSATKAIKNSQLGQDTVIIALTASAFEEEQNSMLEVGCDDLVKKPFKEEIIFEKIAHYLPVEYIYQDKNPKITPPQLPKLTQADLAGINPSWLQSLYLAAIAVDSDLILALIDTLPTSHQHLKSQLIQLVDNYDFDTLIKLTEAYQPST